MEPKIITSSSAITRKCPLGITGFFETQLVKCDEISHLCVYKKILGGLTRQKVIQSKKDFKMMKRLFSKVSQRIPRYFYIVDLLDKDFKGEFGYLMEFCIGGHIMEFAKSWCADGKYEEEEESSSFNSDSDSDSSSDSDYFPFYKSKTMNPVKLSSICIEAIECLDDIFTADHNFIHRDVKPNNFLVRANPHSGKCSLVLSGLSLSKFQTIDDDSKKSIYGTLVYNSYEALEGYHYQLSDAHSLGVSIMTLFFGRNPLLNVPRLRGVDSKLEFVHELCDLLKSGDLPQLSSSPLFQSLQTIDGGKYKPVFKCLNEVFEGLTKFDIRKRMSVHEAREKVQSIKHLLPRFGEGWEAPRIEDVIEEKCRNSYLPKKPKTIPSSSAFSPLCIVGRGGFGERQLVKMKGLPTYCIFKKLLRHDDKKSLVQCQQEFKNLMRLFIMVNPQRVPRPISFVNLLDKDFKGKCGYLMEFCIGGHIMKFARSWCADGKYELHTLLEEEEESSSSDSDSDFDSSFSSNSSNVDVPYYDPKTMNPAKLSSISVEMIECLDDVFTANHNFIHRDVKPEHFLVRSDPDSGKCSLVLSGLSLSKFETSDDDSKKSFCGTYVYNSYEALGGYQSQESDAHSLGMSIMTLFFGRNPLLDAPELKWADSPLNYVHELRDLLISGYLPKLSESPLFQSLQTIDGGKYKPVFKCLNEVFEGLTKFDIDDRMSTIDGGKYKPVFKCLNEVFEGLTKFDIDDRMSVHEAREKVQSIKHLLPRFGEGWEAPRIEDGIDVEEKLRKYGFPEGEEESLESPPSIDSVFSDSLGSSGHFIPAPPESSDSSPKPTPKPSPKPTPKPAVLPQTLTSSSSVTPLCIIGEGGFGVVILTRVEYPGLSSPCSLCALKCMENHETHANNAKCVKSMKDEFSRQSRLYSIPAIQSCVPRPLHILDLLDSDQKGTLGIMMEFCRGGNVMEFAKSWAVDLSKCDPDVDDEDDLVYDPVKIASLCNHETHANNAKCVKSMKDEFSRQSRLYSIPAIQSCVPRPLHILDLLDSDQKGTLGIMMEFCRGGNVMEFAKSWAVDLSKCDPDVDDEDDLVYDPVKIASLCVGIIECVSDVFTAKEQLVHRDIKPDNFLVRHDASKGKCKIVLGDLGLVKIRDTMSQLSSFNTSEHSTKTSFSYKPSIVGTLCYNAPESLKNGFYTQRSDAWGVVLTIWSLFNRMQQPFMTIPTIRNIPHSDDYDTILCSRLIKIVFDPDRLPQLLDSATFCALETLDGGKYKPVYKVFLEVFDGLLNPDRFKRMMINQARVLTDKIKHLLPDVGEGWSCPPLEEYIDCQLEEYKGETGAKYIK
ncbi:hypothetical protein ADUPG1_011195 [Aduncisulcus paluster]|uniref:Protein kinase domain-containing protein n=1 Tax=Aduncisulcus paluster TaxID=2918883 RepID=A0ABQ5JUS2_9EUKA|nr:hypothetical protein ADUPG1_011195 [Aduncisulcus paluster]